MPDENKKENFLQVTSREIMVAVMSMLILAAVGFVFTSFNGRLTKVEEQSAQHEVALNIGLINAVGNLTEELEATTDDMTAFGNNQKSLERTLIRLETIVERWED